MQKKLPEENFFRGDFAENLETKKGQCVGDVFGRVCGNVPKNLASVLKSAIESGLLTHGFVFYSGQFIHAGKIKGGGPQLRCVYILFIKHVGAKLVRKMLEEVGLDVASA